MVRKRLRLGRTQETSSEITSSSNRSIFRVIKSEKKRDGGKETQGKVGEERRKGTGAKPEP